MNLITCQFLFLCLVSRAGHAEENLICPATSNISSGLEWPETATTTLSNPPCADQSRQLASRECQNGVWAPEPSCFYIQPQTLPQCPEDFIDGVSICYYVTPPSAYPPSCPYSNTVSFNLYKDIVSTDGLPIWMPIKRDLSNGLGFLEWVEASDLYKLEYDGDFFVSGGFKGKDCVVYYNSTYMVLVSCDELHLGVCAYFKLDQVREQMCVDSSLGMCYQSDFNPDAMCFCLGGSGQNQTDYTRAEFPKVYQNKVYESLTSDACTIGLQRTTDGNYIWATSQQELEYTYWSTDATFSTNFTYGAATTTGWILTEEPLPCFIFQVGITFPLPELDLTFSNETGFLLKIRNSVGLKHVNSEVLLYCFSNAGALSLTYRYEILSKAQEFDKNEPAYEFLPHAQGPGYYWCEVFNYLTSEPMKSQVLFVNQSEKFGAEFVAILKTQYIGGTNPLSAGLIEFLERIFFIKIKLEQSEASKCSYTSRLMKIMDIDEEKYQALVNVHFTCRVSSVQSVSLVSSSFTDEEFDRMQTLINQTITDLSAITIEMLDFRSATYCVEELSSGLLWPRTELGQTSIPQQFCFTLDGMRVSRRCEGDFINGAQWSDPESCTFPQSSSVTEELLNILRNSDNLSQALYDVSSRYPEFDCLDVYLMALISSDHWHEMENYMFVNVLDNLLKVDSSILANSQEDMRATDMLLHTLDNLVMLRDINSNNLVSISNSNGIVLKADGTVVRLTGVNDLENIIEEFQDLVGAIWLSSDFSSTEEVSFKLFYNTAFFTTSNLSQFARNVFGVSSSEAFKGSVRLLYQLSNTATISGDCVYWSYDLESTEGRGFWKTANQTRNLSNFLLCDFFDVDVSAITVISHYVNNQNVTENLEELLGSGETPTEIINKLSNITDRYGEFTSNDVYLVGKILEKLTNYSDIDLYALAHIVSNLHEIQRGILANSQKWKLATDSILHSIDTIIENHEYVDSVNIVENNFVILISDIKDADFSGLVVFEDNQTLQILNMTGNVTIDDILVHENLVGALYVPPGLKRQLENDSKIIITVFSSDSLFNQANTNFQSVSKIFGIIISLFENYSEPLSVIHRVSTEACQQSCVYWSYDNSQNITGLWKKDNDGKNLSIFSQCDFWHTTHFALLLLDTDKYDLDNNVLDWITTINCGLSMFGLCCIVLTAVLFKRWRTNSGNQILLNFVFASILQISIFYVSSSINQSSADYLLCTIIGVILHYSVVSQFCWMFVIAVLQFKRFVEVLRGPPKHVLLKACLCGWLLPCLPVACVYFLDDDAYVTGHVGLCYPSGLGLYLGIWLPIVIVVVINLVIFVYIMYSVVCRKTECADAGSGEGMFQWRLAVLLFFMLGMTWCFGFLSQLDFGIVFVYAFCITATLQGFVMFLFFIVFNSNTRYLYTRACQTNKKNY